MSVLFHNDQIPEAFKENPMWSRGPASTEWADFWGRRGPFDGPLPWEGFLIPDVVPVDVPTPFLNIFGPRPVVPPGTNPVLVKDAQGEWDNNRRDWRGVFNDPAIVSALEPAQELYTLFGVGQAQPYNKIYFMTEQVFVSFVGQVVQFYRAPLYAAINTPDPLIERYQTQMMQEQDQVPEVIHPQISGIFLKQMQEKFKDDPIASARLGNAFANYERALRAAGLLKAGGA